THGSANHPAVDKVAEATRLVREQMPDLKLDGEVQFDAAWVPELLERKAPEASFRAPANVFVFPNLDAGNIGYKISQRLGGWQVLGPLLQGLNRAINDLSRGCDADDVLAVMAVTSLQAKALREL
ncbi:MAG: phosphate acyltransferase, partial [Granulosicoccaceae bacterium]